MTAEWRLNGPQRLDALDGEILDEIGREFQDDDVYLTTANPEEYADVERLASDAKRADVYSPLTAKTISWLIDRNPDGPGFLILAKTSEADEIVGHFLFYPKALLHRRSPDDPPVFIQNYFHCNLYVVPSHRGQGIFRRMMAFGLEILERFGVGYTYSVPNRRSTPGLLKYGLTRVGTVPFWAQPTWRTWRWINPLAARPRKDIRFEIRSEFDSAFEDLAHRSVSRRARVWGYRSVEHLNWRFRDRPDVDYDISYAFEAEKRVGYIVTRRMSILGRCALVLCDFAFERVSGGHLATGIQTARDRNDEHLDLVMALASTPDKRARRALWRAGLVPIPQRLLPQPVVVIGGPVPGGAGVTLPSTRHWHATPYDWDVF